MYKPIAHKILMGDSFMQKTVTKHQICNITYTVESSSSETATNTLKEKIMKLLLRDLRNKISKNHQ